MTYEIAKFLHITGVVMLMGNITVTAIWKYFADRTQRPEVLSFAQKLVTYTDWSIAYQFNTVEEEGRCGCRISTP